MVPAEHFTGYHHTNRLKDGAGGSRGSYQANTFGFHIAKIPTGATFTKVSPSTEGPEIRNLGYIYTAKFSFLSGVLRQKQSPSKQESRTNLGPY